MRLLPIPRLICPQDAFLLADDVLRQGVQGISDIITIPGLVNVDFADVKAIMCNSGTAMLGVGVSSGKNRAEEAALVSGCLRGWDGDGVGRAEGCAGERGLVLVQPTASRCTPGARILNMHTVGCWWDGHGGLRLRRRREHEADVLP